MAQACAWEKCVRVCVIPSRHPGMRVWSLGMRGREPILRWRRTEYHLHKVFIKLDISSRNQLHGVLTSSRSD